jgi:hypothetical protein
MNPFLSDTVVALLVNDIKALVLTGIVVPLVIIGLLGVSAWFRLRALRKQDEDWGGRW